MKKNQILELREIRQKNKIEYYYIIPLRFENISNKTKANQYIFASYETINTQLIFLHYSSFKIIILIIKKRKLRALKKLKWKVTRKMKLGPLKKKMKRNKKQKLRTLKKKKSETKSNKNENSEHIKKTLK